MGGDAGVDVGAGHDVGAGVDDGTELLEKGCDLLRTTNGHLAGGTVAAVADLNMQKWEAVCLC